MWGAIGQRCEKPPGVEEEGVPGEKNWDQTEGGCSKQPDFTSQEIRYDPLRQRMLEDMQLRNFSAGTQRSYIHYVEGFANYYKTSPARLGLDEIRNYKLYLLEERKSVAAKHQLFHQCGQVFVHHYTGYALDR